MSNIVVSRFGGDEASDAQEIMRSAQVLLSDPSRRYAIVSAPGSTHHSVGITDMLYLCHARKILGENYDDIFTKITERFYEIVSGLGLNFDLNAELSAVKRSIDTGMSLDYIASRGEYITAKIFAQYINWPMIDAKELIFFKNDGNPDIPRVLRTASEKLRDYEYAIIPSFYGTSENGGIHTFVRGDCDSAGALISCAVNADLYEKWSEAAKIYSADPSVVENPAVIRNITYVEALELNYTGINLVTDNVILLLNGVEIPMRILSTHKPDDAGMLISPKLPEGSNRKITACISGNRNYTTVHIRKYGLNKDYSFNEKLFAIFAKQHIACQLSLSGIHQMSVILKAPVFDIRRNQIIGELQQELSPESINVEKGLAIIAVIGEGMGTVKGIFGKIFDALASVSVKAKMIEQGADQQNIIIGVADRDYDATVKVLYNELILK